MLRGSPTGNGIITPKATHDLHDRSRIAGADRSTMFGRFPIYGGRDRNQKAPLPLLEGAGLSGYPLHG